MFVFAGCFFYVSFGLVLKVVFKVSNTDSPPLSVFAVFFSYIMALNEIIKKMKTIISENEQDLKEHPSYRYKQFLLSNGTNPTTSSNLCTHSKILKH